MKRSMKTMAVLLAIAMSLAVVQTASAVTTDSITGTIKSYDEDGQWVEVDGVTINCIPFDFLDRNGTPIEDMDGEVTINYTVRTYKNCATSIVYENETIYLPGSRGKKK